MEERLTPSTGGLVSVELLAEPVNAFAQLLLGHARGSEIEVEWRAEVTGVRFNQPTRLEQSAVQRGTGERRE